MFYALRYVELGIFRKLCRGNNATINDNILLNIKRFANYLHVTYYIMISFSYYYLNKLMLIIISLKFLNYRS